MLLKLKTTSRKKCNGCLRMVGAKKKIKDQDKTFLQQNGKCAYKEPCIPSGKILQRKDNIKVKPKLLAHYQAALG